MLIGFSISIVKTDFKDLKRGNSINNKNKIYYEKIINKSGSLIKFNEESKNFLL